MKKNLFIGIVLLAIMVVAFVFVLGNPVQKKSMVIGAVIPQTGSGSYWGKAVMMGIGLAQVDLNAKYGTDIIHISVEDSQSNLAAGVTAANKLLSVNKADALYTEFSGISNAVAPVAKAAGKVLVYSAFNQKIVAENEGTAKTFISFEVACQRFAESLGDKSRNSKVLIISSIGDVAPSCEKGLKQGGIAMENTKTVDGFVGSDFRTVLLQNKTFNPDYIIPIMYEDGSYALLKQKNELGIHAALFCYSQDCATQKILNDLPHEYTEGTRFFEIPLDPTFIVRIKEKYHGITNEDMQGAANAYQSVMALGDALHTCENGGVSCVISAISNKPNASWVGYKNAEFSNRILQSDIVIGQVKNGAVITTQN